MTHIGIDGCKGGWLLVSLKSPQNIIITLLENIQTINFLLKEVTSIWIDMPIGLSEGAIQRDVEVPARKLLRPYRAASIFTPACREAIYQADYQSAKTINLKQCGKSISIQSWHISPKIKELDRYLLDNQSTRPPFFEAHPEICFAALNEMKPLQASKHMQKGLEKRLALLTSFIPQAEELYQQALKQFPRKHVKADDIVDAICLAVCSWLGAQHGVIEIRGSNLQDMKGLEMRLVYPNIH